MWVALERTLVMLARQKLEFAFSVISLFIAIAGRVILTIDLAVPF